MFANLGERLFLVVNAARKAHDFAHLEAGLGDVAEVVVLDRALIALQGPGAEAALAALAPEVAAMRFMDVAEVTIEGAACLVSRSGYTGEDGYEISVPAEAGERVATRLLSEDGVLPVGLGARDSLRLEAGLCLYGHDIDETTSPVEAALEWAIQGARRRGGARQGGFPGADAILGQIEAGASRRRVGLRPEGRAPMREGVELAAEAEGPAIGRITSGGFGPTLGGPVAMGYVPAEHAAPETRLQGLLRGKALPVTVTRLPFIKPGYKRG
jgi:aminomethyltransferase